MHLTRCPNCHARIDLASCVEDEAGRELLAAVAKMPTRLSGPALAYLGLFRPAKQDLRNSRALKLLNEALAFSSDHYLLAAAMNATVQQISQHRQQGQNDPLKNHNYLKKVLTGMAERFNQPLPTQPQTEGERSQPTPDESKQQNERAWRQQMRALGFSIDENGRLVQGDNQS